MNDDFAAIAQLAGNLIRSLDPAERRSLLRRMARAIRASQSARIARQQEPDGAAFIPRKPQPTGRLRRKGKLREKTMFRKLRSARHLKAGATDVEAWVGFSGRVARIAAVHQDGLPDAPARGRAKVRYARRQLLGLTDDERTLALDMLLNHVAGR